MNISEERLDKWSSGMIISDERLYKWSSHSIDKLLYFSNDVTCTTMPGNVMHNQLDLEYESHRLPDRATVQEMAFLNRLESLYINRIVKITYFQVATRYPDSGASVTHYRVLYTLTPKES